jgi:hypothetical protein
LTYVVDPVVSSGKLCKRMQGTLHDSKAAENEDESDGTHVEIAESGELVITRIFPEIIPMKPEGRLGVIQTSV